MTDTLPPGLGWDCETFLIRPGKLAPELVCLSVACYDGVWLYHVDEERNPEPLKLYGGESAKPPAHTAKDAFRWIMRQDVSYGLNVAYDVAVCLAQWPDLTAEVFAAYDDDRVIDVGLNQQLIDIAHGKLKRMQATFGYSLAGLERRLMRRNRSAQKTGQNVWRLRYRELIDVPLSSWPEAAIDYAAEDAVGARDIGQVQWDSEDRKYLRDAPAQARAAFALHLLMCWGVMTDPEKIDALAKNAEVKYWELSDQLAKRENGSLVRGFDADSRKLYWTKDVKAAKQRMLNVCKERGIPVSLTDTGYKKYLKYLRDRGLEARESEIPPEQVLSPEEMLNYASVDEEACQKTGDEILIAFSLRSQLHTVLHTHVEDLRKGVTTPIQPRYVTLVDSGRTSCSKTRTEEGKSFSPTNGFQFQNPKRAYMYIPPGQAKPVPLFPEGVGVRECFVARPGMFFGDNDFSGLELSTGAQACIDLVGFSMLGEAINKGIDPHLDFGATLMGISYEDALARKHDKDVKHYRQVSKCANFGLPGGLGIRGLVGFARGYGVKLTEQEAQKLKQDWFDKYPEWRFYFNWIRSQLELDLEVTEGEDERKLRRVLGTFEMLRVGRTRGRCSFTEAANSYFQALGSDVAKRALWGVAKRCYVRMPDSTLYGARPVGFIHDEILAELHVELAHEQAYEMAEVMCAEGNVLLPDVPVKCVPALSKYWCKGVEAVFDKNGRLQPYDLARDGRWEVYFDKHAEFRVKW